jgi:hypothetical protein
MGGCLKGTVLSLPASRGGGVENSPQRNKAQAVMNMLVMLLYSCCVLHNRESVVTDVPTTLTPVGARGGAQYCLDCFAS